jgi:hypothetical protein
VEITGVLVEHPRADELRRIYEVLGIPAVVVESETARIRVKLDGRKGSFELISGDSLLEYYAARSTRNIK